jgi:hypothetical protein
MVTSFDARCIGLCLVDLMTYAGWTAVACPSSRLGLKNLA